MDYSVGSLSDLINGTNTLNKKKVIRRKLTTKRNNLINDAPVSNQFMKSENHNEDVNVSQGEKKVKKTKKKVRDNTEENPLEEVDVNRKLKESDGKNEPVKKQSKKRKNAENHISLDVKQKLEESDAENEPVKKRSKKRKNTESGIGLLDVKQKSEENDAENEPIKKQSKNSKNAERRINSKEKPKHLEEDPELVSRTVFVGNLPISSNTKKLKRFFMKYGKVETVRIRGAPVADPKTSKKVAVIKKEFHPERKSFFGFVRFEEREGAIKATEANRMVYQDHHLRVHLCDVKDRPDENKAIFVGNLSFYAEEDDLWKLFESCGPISSVRIVRDGKTGIGKGFGYVNFENSDAVPLALEMENVKLKDRELRISICNINAAKKNKKNNKIKKISKPGKPKIHKKLPKTEKVATQDKESTGPTGEPKTPFQGVNFAEKKKKKFNKGLLQKKKFIKQLAPK